MTATLLSPPVTLDTWTALPWAQYLDLLEDPAYNQAKAYYHNGLMRLEMSPLGNPHSRDHFIVMTAIALYASLKGIDLDGHDNCTFRKAGYAEVQPDVAVYVDDRSELIPWDTVIIDLERYPVPDLAIEVSASSLADDQGPKRLLYEALGVREYWIVDVERAEIVALAVRDRGSYRIEESLVLPGLGIALLEEALRRSRTSNHGKVSAWLLEQWQDGSPT
ncbi:MAG: Uma2 family endonuclease [Prochlorotrichaceae cyanobacterium]